MTFVCVFLAGGWLFGVICLILGCILGHQSGERQVAQLRADADKAHGDMLYRLSDGTDISRMTANEIAAHLHSPKG